MFILKDIIVFLSGMIIVFILCKLFKTDKNIDQNEVDQDYIPYNKIPKLSRTIHCCENLNNLNCNNGDLVEYKKDGNESYFVYSNYRLYKLTTVQVLRLEKDYNIRIIF